MKVVDRGRGGGMRSEKKKILVGSLGVGGGGGRARQPKAGGNTEEVEA